MKNIFFLIFAVVGLGSMYLAYVLYASSADLVAHGIKAQGQVIQNIEDISDDSTTYHPKIQFTTAEGENIQFTSNTSTNPPAFGIGQGVNILYPKGAPDQAVIDDFLFLWLGPLIAGGLGIMFFGIGTWLFYSNSRSDIKNMMLRFQEKQQSNNPLNPNPPTPPTPPLPPTIN
jgi:hypothetical protein